MAITKNPGGNTVSETVIDALIGRGGSEAETGDTGKRRKRGQGRPAQHGMTKVVIRVPEDLLERIEAAVEARPLPVPRQHWILEALLEKVERESPV